ncbi:LysR family transcriptional regulator [Pseudomonas lalucatii]|uniref:LysR family transcriptional regulator n=1 Tax=Pseudomonas lalucatii TaxID=1424203 RepID=A0ABS5PYL2_9PSED|nr:LysR family transcriptional regulator [Pseudomonas lalucatii]MBS7661288.1 LysR family transcriptional regulator [Pseudomonas lalucatii]MBS7724177.1 LysR family transcriptional regulator [Pseudomonas lalucatii]
MDKLGALRMFVATAEHGSFSRAAEQLGKTPSALTKAVSHLEAELGARLFERSTRRTALTEAGRLYLETARLVLQRLHDAGEEIGQLQHGLHGSLRVTAPLAFGRAFLDEACAAFLLAHPHIRLRVDLSDAFIELAESGYDLALREGRSDQPGLIAKSLAHNRIVLCASPAYLAAHPAPVCPENFARHQWLIYRHPVLDSNHWWLSLDGRRLRVPQPQPRLESDNYDLLLANTLGGAGLHACPTWSVQPYLESGQLCQLMSEYEFDPDAFGHSILAVYPSHRRATRKVQAFIEHLAGCLVARGLA